MKLPIYMDYNATTPVDPAVVDVMLPYWHEHFGNASSAHGYGYLAHAAMESARSQVAALLHAKPKNVIFTGGGSETNNLAIVGTVFRQLDRRPHVVSTVIEHPAVLNTLQYLHRRFAVDFTLVPADQYGLVSPDDIRLALRKETVLITVMHANNEVGTLQPVREIGVMARELGIPFHVDAAQSAGKVAIDVDDLYVDLVTIAGHKLYGPKGVGALYLRHRIELDSLIHGSGQERGMRAGTENVPSIVGLGKACEIAAVEQPHELPRLSTLRDRLHSHLTEHVPSVMLNGHPTMRLPNTLNISVPGTNGQEILGGTPEVAASTGSACHSGSTEPSAVLLAMGLSPARAGAALRLSIGRWTTEAEIDTAARLLEASYASHTAASKPA